MRESLRELAEKHGTDKADHGYCEFYEELFGRRRDDPVRVLELGVGGFECPDDATFGGASLRMWKDYFSHGAIVSLDINDKTALSEPRIDIVQASQTDRAVLARLSRKYGPFDYVIDDASHVPALTNESFEILFPLLRSGGIYVIEDLSTSYWPKWGGAFRLNTSRTTMSLVKRRLDGLNFAEFKLPRFQPDEFDREIVEIQSRHNIVAFFKGDNSLPSDLNAPHPVSLPTWIRNELAPTVVLKAKHPMVLRAAEMTGTRSVAAALRRRMVPDISR